MYNIFRTQTGQFMYAEQGSEFELLAPVVETASNIDFAQGRCNQLNDPNREIPLDVRDAYSMYRMAVDADNTKLILPKLEAFTTLCDKYKLPYGCMDKKGEVLPK